MLFIPIRAGQTRIQVIRNDEEDLTDDQLSELQKKLEDYEKSKPIKKPVSNKFWRHVKSKTIV